MKNYYYVELGNQFILHHIFLILQNLIKINMKMLILKGICFFVKMELDMLKIKSSLKRITSYFIIYSTIKEINDIKIPGCKYIYDVNVQFEIEIENGIAKQKIANYWVTYYKNKFYIYGDNFLQDIYILKKDIN